MLLDPASPQSRLSAPSGPVYDSARPQGRLRDAVRNVVSRRGLVVVLARRDLVLRYRRSMLGVAWTLLNPALMVGVMWLVFSHFLRPAELRVPFVIYLLTGVIVFTFYQQAITQVGGSLLQSQHLLARVNVPAEVLAFAATAAILVNTAILLVPLVALQLVLGVGIPWTFPLVVPVLLLLFGFGLGGGLMVAAVAVRFQDCLNIVQHLLNLLSYLTPTFYLVSTLPPTIRHVILCNPLAHDLALFRAVAYEGTLGDPLSWLAATASTVVFLALGIRMFTAAARTVAVSS